MINTIINTLLTIIRFFWKSNTAEDKRLKEDLELANAIKNGDSDTVNKIRERRKHYSNILVFVIVLFLLGCTSIKDVPLTSGTVAYQIPAGLYVDTKGNTHNESHTRWSLSEEDLYNSTRQIKPETKYNWFNWQNIVVAILTLNIFLVYMCRKR